MPDQERSFPWGKTIIAVAFGILLVLGLGGTLIAGGVAVVGAGLWALVVQGLRNGPAQSPVQPGARAASPGGRTRRAGQTG